MSVAELYDFFIRPAQYGILLPDLAETCNLTRLECFRITGIDNDLLIEDPIVLLVKVVTVFKISLGYLPDRRSLPSSSSDER